MFWYEPVHIIVFYDIILFLVMHYVLISYIEDSGDTITIRGCALDSGTLTTDTEIIRMSHCGSFYYEDRYAFQLVWYDWHLKTHSETS